MSTDLTATIDKYLMTWTEPDDARRADLVKELWADDGRLIDPPLTAEGHDGISQMAATLQNQFSGHRFERASAVDTHHEYFRFAWNLIAPDGDVAVSGIDVGEVAGDGRLKRITGFFGDLQPV